MLPPLAAYGSGLRAKALPMIRRGFSGGRVAQGLRG